MMQARPSQAGLARERPEEAILMDSEGRSWLKNRHGRVKAKFASILGTLVVLGEPPLPWNLSAVHAQTPIARWKLDETEGTVAIDAIGGFDGMYQDGATPGEGTPFLDGSPTARFDGISGFVLLPSSTAIAATWGTLTVEAWGYLDATTDAFQAILSPPDH